MFTYSTIPLSSIVNFSFPIYFRCFLVVLYTPEVSTDYNAVFTLSVQCPIHYYHHSPCMLIVLPQLAISSASPVTFQLFSSRAFSSSSHHHYASAVSQCLMTDITKHSFHFSAPTVWNSLPASVITRLALGFKI